MIPVLHRNDSTDFSSLGYGALIGTVECSVLEQLNGIYELNMTILASDPLIEYVTIGAIVSVTPNMTDGNQAFVIEQIIKHIDGKVEIYGTHIAQHRAKLIPVSPFTANTLGSALSSILSNSLEPNPFTLTANYSSTNTMTAQVPHSMRELMGGMEGSLLDIYGGEFKYDNFGIQMLSKRGRDNDVRIFYGKNMTEFTDTEAFTWDGSATGVVPYWYKEEEGRVIGTVQYSDYANLFPYKKTVTVDLTDQFDMMPTVSELNDYALAWIKGKGMPDITLEVGFDQFDMTDANVNTIQIGDTVHIINSLYDISYESRIVSTNFNVLSETYKSVTVGSLKATINEAISEVGTSGKVNVSSGVGGSTNYNDLTNKPSINGITLQGNITIPTIDGTITNAEIDSITA